MSAYSRIQVRPMTAFQVRKAIENYQALKCKWTYYCIKDTV